jgi:GNAT superfamily N-acetyltransferase
LSDQRIRPAVPADVSAIVQLVHELAEYERLPEQCHLTGELLRNSLFNESPAVFGHVAELDGEIVGYTLHFLNYSTWEGLHGIYLEDLYVRPEYRGSGLGKALLVNLAEIAVRSGYARVEWSVLDWNAPSIAFYESLGAVGMDGWTVYRLTGPALARTGMGNG